MTSDETHGHDGDKTGDCDLHVPCLATVDDERISDLLAHQLFFWIDLENPTEAEIARLGRLLDLHPLALEDTLHFGQRPKLDNYGSYAFMVFYSAREEDAESGGALCEVHLFIAGSFLVTVHREPLRVLREQHTSIEKRMMRSEQFVIYRVLDSLTDTYFPVLSVIDDQIDGLEDEIITEPTDDQLRRIFRLKRDLVAMRKVITPQRDLLVRGIDTLAEIPGLTLDERDYFRDVYDHLIRISDLLDSYRDLLAGALDAHLSTVANRQNEVMKQLTVIATIFLPLSFITGFFGMNFAFLITNVQHTLVGFLTLGVGGCLVSIVVLWVYFRRKRWVAPSRRSRRSGSVE